MAATVAIGLAAIRHGLAKPIGMTTEEPPVGDLPLAKLSNIVLGGHEVSKQTVNETLQQLHERSGLFTDPLIRTTATDIKAFERNIRPGALMHSGEAIRRLKSRPGVWNSGTAQQAVDRIRRDLRSFAKQNRLANVVVINVASTEPPFALGAVHKSWTRLESALRGPKPVLPSSSLYALAAIEESMPYVNFTPSLGADVPALRERAATLGACIMGADGKTGETLLKSVLAPMFRDRCLRVLSWAGHNILGNRDGRVLVTPGNKASKLKTKDGLLRSMLGVSTQTHTAIEFVESLDDWKTAWDHIHFEGFLGTKMSLQFIWQGCDSVLAAPLILDLARLAEYHASSGGSGVMTHLSCFFKAPMDVTEHRFSRQIEMLQRYAMDRARGR